jgi:hypothetical protein
LHGACMSFACVLSADARLQVCGVAFEMLVAAGTILPLRIRQVRATATTAMALVGLI